AVAHGRAAHAGNQHEVGKNAIWSLARFVDRAQALTDYARGITVNVGKITGGQGRNTVPDRCEALIDLRFVSTADGEATVEKLREAAVDAAIEGTRIELSGGVARPPLARTPDNVALAAEYGACARAAGLGATRPTSWAAAPTPAPPPPSASPPSTASAPAARAFTPTKSSSRSARWPSASRRWCASSPAAARHEPSAASR